MYPFIDAQNRAVRWSYSSFNNSKYYGTPLTTTEIIGLSVNKYALHVDLWPMLMYIASRSAEYINNLIIEI